VTSAILRNCFLKIAFFWDQISLPRRSIFWVHGDVPVRLNSFEARMCSSALCRILAHSLLPLAASWWACKNAMNLYRPGPLPSRMGDFFPWIIVVPYPHSIRGGCELNKSIRISTRTPKAVHTLNPHGSVKLVHSQDDSIISFKKLSDCISPRPTNSPRST